MSTRAPSVLLIEDDEMQVALLEEFLKLARPEGVVVKGVSTLSAGLAQLAQGGFHVVVMDLSLPDSCGLDTLLEVRKHAPDVPTVVMTGQMDPQLQADAMAAGARRFLVKAQAGHDEVVEQILAIADGGEGE